MRVEIRFTFVLALATSGCGSVAGGAANPDGGQQSDTRPPDTASTDTGSGDDGSPDAFGCVPSPAGLQARWRGEMNADDDTGVFNGTAMGGVAYTSGRYASAFLFDGVNDLVTADPSDALYPPASFSIEAWIDTSTSGSYVTVVNKYDCGGSDGCSGSFWGLDIDQNGHAIFAFRVNGSPSNVVTLTASVHAVTDGAWHHLVGVRDVTATSSLLYIDGQLAVSTAISGADLGAINNADGFPDPVTIGAGRVSGVDTYNQYFTGAIDDVAYYTHAMTAAEVAALYAAPAGVCSGP
jgi:hypothetical protein